MERSLISINGNECGETSRIKLTLPENVRQSVRLRTMIAESVRKVLGKQCLNLWIIDEEILDVDVPSSAVKTENACERLLKQIDGVFKAQESNLADDVVQE